MRNLKDRNNPYALLDIEVTQPLPEMPLSDQIVGIAVLVRRKGRPVHFWMESLPGNSLFTAKDLERITSRKSGIRLLKASIRDELITPMKVDRFPSVTVAVCTRNRTRLLTRCLKSLQSAVSVVSGKPVPVEILVVDNAPSARDTEALVASRPGVRYVLEPRPGLDFARNRAIREARGDLIAYVDDDTVVDPRWLLGLMEAWTAYPGAACFTGQVLPLELTTKAQIIFEKRGGFRRGFDPICYGAELEGHPAYPCSAGVIGTGANMAFQKHILVELNGFDEALDTGPPLPAAGDHDIFYRLVKAGHSIVYAPDFLVFHEHRKELRSLTRQYWSWGLGVMTFMDKIRRTDPSQWKIRRYLIRLWFGEHIVELMSSVLRRTPVPWYMVLTEMAGGVVGLCGGYSRSVSRIKQIRVQFPSIRNAEGVEPKATPQARTSSRQPDRRASHFKPWEILHLDLSQGIVPLISIKGTGGIFVVFWWRGIPLGQQWIRTGRLPMGAAGLRECALAAITPVVANYLVKALAEPSFPHSSFGPHRTSPKELAELPNPLEQLEKCLSFPAADTPCPTISVVVCTRERPEQLRRCLTSLQSLSRMPHEIMVVDSAPRSDTTYQIVSQFPHVRYIREPRPGLDVARNRGVMEASSEIVAFTDDDTVVHPDWITRILQGFDDPLVMAVTGLVLPAELETEAQFLFETHWGFGKGYLPKVFGPRFFEGTRSRGAPVWEIGAGANMAFRREVFDQVGLFDERLDVGAAGCSGDSEIWYRILEKGWSCRYEPTAVVHHYHRKDHQALTRQLYHYMRGHVAALLIQFERHRHWGNLRRLVFSLPCYYGGLSMKGVLNGFAGRGRTLKAEVMGALSGITYYVHNRHVNAHHLTAN